LKFGLARGSAARAKTRVRKALVENAAAVRWPFQILEKLIQEF
jgi:hypothetical protein